MTPGEANIAPETKLATRALLDALDALGPAHRDALVLVGAQAIYLHVGNDDLAVPQFTHDADLAVNPELVAASPLIIPALEAVGFTREPPPGSTKSSQPGQFHKLIDGQWIEVDLLVPDAIASVTHPNRRRSAGVDPHGRNSMARAAGLEAALIDNAYREIHTLTEGDARAVSIRVAGPAALLMAKAHKLGERTLAKNRVDAKDALDIYRLLAACNLTDTAMRLRELSKSEAGLSVLVGIDHLSRLFASPTAEGSVLAAAAVGAAADPAVIRERAALLVRTVLRVPR